MNILCRLGWHKWEDLQTRLDFEKGEIYQAKICKKCGLFNETKIGCFEPIQFPEEKVNDEGFSFFPVNLTNCISAEKLKPGEILNMITKMRDTVNSQAAGERK